MTLTSCGPNRNGHVLTLEVDDCGQFIIRSTMGTYYALPMDTTEKQALKEWGMWHRDHMLKPAMPERKRRFS